MRGFRVHGCALNGMNESGMSAAVSRYTCRFCSSLHATLREYVSHLRVIHAKDPKFNLMCVVGNCREVFRAFSAFSSHVYRRHRSVMGVGREALESVMVEHLQAPATNVYSEFDTNYEGDELDPISEHGSREAESSSLFQSSNCSTSDHEQVITAAKMILEL